MSEARPDPAAGDQQQRHQPTVQYLAAPAALDEMARFRRGRVYELTPTRAFVLAVLGGGITVGALFSVLLSAGVDAEGPKLLLEGVGFSAGFFFAMPAEAALFTQANVALSTTLLGHQ